MDNGRGDTGTVSSGGSGVSLTLKTRLDKCTAEGKRYAMANLAVYPRPGGAWLVATDGRVAATVPVEGQCEAKTFAPGEYGKPGKLLLNGQWRHEFKKIIQEGALVEEGKDAPVNKLLEKLKPETLVAVRLNTKLLANLAAAITEGNDDKDLVTLFIDPKKPTSVIIAEGNAGIGAIQPLDNKGPHKLAEQVESFLAASAP